MALWLRVGKIYFVGNKSEYYKELIKVELFRQKHLRENLQSGEWKIDEIRGYGSEKDFEGEKTVIL